MKTQGSLNKQHVAMVEREPLDRAVDGAMVLEKAKDHEKEHDEKMKKYFKD